MGNGVGLSRDQQSINKGLQKIDSHLTANEGYHISEQVYNIVTQPKSSDSLRSTLKVSGRKERLY